MNIPSAVQNVSPVVQKEVARAIVSEAPEAKVQGKPTSRSTPRIVEERVRNTEPEQANHAGVKRESLVRTIFDDLVKLGLDPNRLTVEA